jgi:hypothetical protein
MHSWEAEAALDQIRTIRIEVQADMETLIKQRDAARANADFLRESVGECHLMISRNTPAFQTRHDWDATTLPFRVRTLIAALQVAEARAAALTAERDTAVVSELQSVAAAKSEAEQARDATRSVEVYAHELKAVCERQAEQITALQAERDEAQRIAGQCALMGKQAESALVAAREALARETEACARVVETQYRRDGNHIDNGFNPSGAKRRLTERIAAAIRERAALATKEPLR